MWGKRKRRRMKLIPRIINCGVQVTASCGDFQLILALMIKFSANKWGDDEINIRASNKVRGLFIACGKWA